MSHALRTTFAVAAALAFALPASAQQNQPAQASSAAITSASAQSAGVLSPAMGSLAFAVAAPSTAFDVPETLVVQRSSQNVALMIVGGAGLLVGAVIGGDEGTIIMIAGGAIGLLGLYRYLR